MTRRSVHPGGEASATVYLIDASPYIFRAYFSLPDSIRTPAGEPVNAVYGFASFLLKLIADEAPSHLAATFDGSLTTSFRNDLYPAYKAQRALPPAELEAQLDRCRAVAGALGVATFIDDRYEADDLIATLARPLIAAGQRVVVVTSDKDLAQLVGPRVSLYDFGKGERMGPAEVAEKFGVPPERIVDLLGLAGDTVDNIPGVKGVGKKTAAAVIAALGDLPAIYRRLDEVAGLPIRGAAALARKLAEQKETALLSRRLATVADDAPCSATLDDLAWTGADHERVDRLFPELGFERIRERITRWA